MPAGHEDGARRRDRLGQDDVSAISSRASTTRPRARVSIDGIDVRELTFESLAAAVGVVSQETYLFHATVRENLRFAKPDATDEEVEEAARAAQIHELIASLPDGYDTVVGERGYRFSGGEKQRMAIARTVLRNPPILVLDEATSALDTQTERLVQEALERLAEGRTTIAIAHRLSTVRDADQIVVLDRRPRRRDAARTRSCSPPAAATRCSWRGTPTSTRSSACRRRHYEPSGGRRDVGATMSVAGLSRAAAATRFRRPGGADMTTTPTRVSAGLDAARPRPRRQRRTGARRRRSSTPRR